jgi:hypothetical protein
MINIQEKLSVSAPGRERRRQAKIDQSSIDCSGDRYAAGEFGHLSWSNQPAECRTVEDGQRFTGDFGG